MKKLLRYIFTIVLTFLLSVPTVGAYERYATTTSGVDFWLSFLNNNSVAASDRSLTLEVIVASREACEVNIDVNGRTITTLTLADQDEQRYTFLATDVYPTQVQTVEKKGVRVYAKDGKTPFSCYTYSSVEASPYLFRDASLVLPSAALGREYVVQMAEEDAYATEFIVVAAEDTKLTIYPSVETEMGNGPDRPIENITLKRGETYWVKSLPNDKATTQKQSIDLSGTRICSTKPIAVFVGNQATMIPTDNTVSPNHAYEQILPVIWQGTKFYFALTGNQFTNYNRVKVVSIYDETDVTISSKDGVFSQQNVTEPITFDMDSANAPNCVIEATKPVLVMGYMSNGDQNVERFREGGRNYTVKWGNAAMAMLPAWNQRVDTMNLVAFEIKPSESSEFPNKIEYYAQVITAATDTTLVQMDGTTVRNVWKVFTSDPSVAYANVPLKTSGYHQFTTTGSGIIGTVEGQAHGQAYMYTLGYAPRPLRDSLYRDGEYMHQFPDFPIGEERLDTTYVCDSTELNFMGKLAGDMAFDSLVWQVYRVDTLTHTRELDSTEVVLNTADRQHDWKYLFTLEPQEDLKPEERTAYQFYEVDLLLYRTPLICDMAEPEVDTLQTMVHVARMYNDTILQRVICAGDSAACFLDAGHEDAEGYWVLSDDSADDKPTQFVGEDVAEDQYHTRYVKGDNYYTRKYHTIYGCDSTMIFYLHVCDTFRTVIDTTVCTNDTLFFDTDHFNRKRFPKGLHEWGVYFDTLKTTQCDEYKLIDPTFMGCDSIFELHLDTCSSYLFDTVATLCTNGKVKFHWRKYDIDETDPHMIPHYEGSRISYWTGVFYDSLTTENICDHCAKECDSVYRLTLTIPNHYEYHASDASYCDSVYQDAGMTYTFTRYTGYNWSGHTKDADGQPRTLWIREIDGVEKDSMIRADRLTYLPYGQYLIHDSLKSQYDCDSVWILPLTVGHTFFRHERYDISDNVPFTWIGHKGAEGKDRTYGPYYGEADSTRHFDHDNQVSKLTGCDSIYRLELVIAKHFEELTYDTICQDSTYTWTHVSQTQTYTRTYNVPGTYHLWDSCKTETLPIKDSIYHHQLLVKPKYRLLVHDSICDCQTKYDFNGHILNDTVYRWKTDDEHELVIKDSIHLDTRTPGIACDSFVILNLHVWRSYEFRDTIHVCQDRDAPTQYWHGKAYSIHSVDTLRLQDLRKTKRGIACDSNYYHTIVVDPSYRVEVKDTICQTELPYTWEDHFDVEGNPLTFNSDTVYVDTLKTHGCHECDSVVTLRLKVMDNTNRSHKVALCKNDEVYYDPIIRMSFNPQMDSMTVGLHTYYPLVHTAEYACPYYDTLYLQINPIYNEPIKDTVICRSDAPFEWLGREGRQVWGVDQKRWLDPLNIPISTSKTYTYIDSARTHGCDCDSVMTLRIRVLPTYDFAPKDTTMSNEESMTWFGHTYAGRNNPLAGQPGVIVLNDGMNEFDTILSTTPINNVSCDSIYHLHLRVGKVFRDTAYAVICAGDTYDWHITSPITGQETVFPNLAGKPGETVLYYDSLRTSLDFDSIYVLKLYQLPEHRYYATTDTVCEDSGATGAFYDWIDHAGPDHHLSINGVPTTVFPTDTFGLFILRDSLKTKECFPVRASGEKTFTTYTPSCDSIYTLSLYIAPVYNAVYNKIVDTLTICDNESVVWEGRTYRGVDYPADGDKPKWYEDTDTYFDKTALSQTCTKIKDCADSIRFLTLKVRPTSYVEKTQTICNNDEFTFGEQSGPYGSHHFVWRNQFVLPVGQIRDTTITLYDTVHNVYACDSVTKMTLTVHPSYHILTDTMVCASELGDFVWRGRTGYLVDVDDYDYQYTKTFGCDSTFHLHLTVIPNILEEQTIDYCEGDTMVWRGQRIHASFVTPTQPDYEQTYRAKYTTQQGCEAEAILHVRFHHIYHTVEQHEACDTEDYIFVGRRYRLAFWRSALQKDTVVKLDTLVHSVYGCDSAVTHYLTIHPSYAFHENRTICSDESVTIQGRTYHSDVATTLLDTVHYSTIYDCDSIYYISVRVNQSYHWTDDQERCAQDLNFDWYGIQVRHSAEEVAKWHNDTILYYTDDHHTIHNCDSTYHLTILAHPVRYEERTDSICEGDYYVSPSHRVWRKEGTYYDTTFTALGCPIYHTIHLRVLQPTSYTFKIAPVCANDPVALLYYEYQGEKPLSYSLLFDDMAHDQLFYDQHEIPLDPYLDYLTLEMPPHSADPMQYPRPARYAVQVMMDNGVCRDSSLLLFPATLEVRYPDWITEQHWNDAIGILVPELNGRDVVTGTGYSFSSYQWYRNDSILYGETRPFLFAPHYLMAGAKYSVELTREGETEAIRTCDIVAHNHAVDHVVPTQPFMSVTPLVVDHRHPEVNIIASEPGSYILYTSYGVRLKSGAYIPDEHLAATVELPILSGVYVFELTSQSGMHRSVKVIVE